MPRTVLVADPDPVFAADVGQALRRRGFRVLAAEDGNRAAELFARHRPAAVVAGVLLPGASGFRLAQLVNERSDGLVPVVLLSPLASTAYRDYALTIGVDDFLILPVPPAAVADAVEAVCPHSRTASRVR